MSTKNVNIKSTEKVIPEKVVIFASQLPKGMTAILVDKNKGEMYHIESAEESGSTFSET